MLVDPEGALEGPHVHLSMVTSLAQELVGSALDIIEWPVRRVMFLG